MFTLESNDGSATFVSGNDRLRIGFLHESIVCVTFTRGRAFSDKPSRIVIPQEPYSAWAVTEEADAFRLATPSLAVFVNKQSGSLRYEDGRSNVLFREPERGGKWLTPKKVYRNLFRHDAAVASAQSIDGERAAAAPHDRVFDRDAFEAKLEFVFGEGEALFGLGSHEEGYGNLRGKSRELYQQNMKAVVPSFVSTRGYGVLLDCCSLMTFHDDAYGSYWWADVVDELKFYVYQGDSFDDVTRNYHRLTGPVPMLPKWALGYTQSKERYVTATELIAVVAEYRRRQIPLDVIVLDWKSWPNGGGWGQKSFDEVRFPDPDGMTAQLHAMGARLMVSIWPIMTGGCPNQKELLDRQLMLGNQATYNAFLPEARDCYWQQAQKGLFDHGIDAWWCDCTEPFEADWSGAVKPEPHARLLINTEQSKLYLDAGDLNAYSLLHSQGIYEGQRRATDAKRVVNLTRSSYAGQHRYATVTWNGDTCATWETLRRSIPEGLNFCATGEPYWTVDIGAFFLDNKPDLWFWRGDYPEGCRGLTAMDALEPDPQDTGCIDRGYWELYVRWLQYAVFLPMFRSHGTDAAREVWRFGEGTVFYETLVRFIRLRYELMPYLYSLVANVTRNSSMMVRALALDFLKDRKTHDITDQFLFGPSILVCPVTTPMDRDGFTRSVYLPAGYDWFDFWTGDRYCGGTTIDADAPLEKLPLFVRAGSLIPMADAVQHVDEKPGADYEIRVYGGADAAFTLYEDAGDGYDYERGGFALMHLTWNDAQRELTLSAREGDFPTLVKERNYSIQCITGLDREARTLRYTGKKIVVRLSRGKD
jgi:alpha-D-xyloside xylohydrolase